jgi:hypothetical protein
MTVNCCSTNRTSAERMCTSFSKQPHTFRDHRVGGGSFTGAPACRLDVSTHPEGPALDISINILRGFPRSFSKCSVGSQIPRLTVLLSCGLQCNYGSRPTSTCCLHLRDHFTYSIPNALPCPKLSIRGTSGHCPMYCVIENTFPL